MAADETNGRGRATPWVVAGLAVLVRPELTLDGENRG